MLLTEYFGIYYLVSNIFAFLSGLIVNYILSLVWVFDNRKIKKKRKELIIFTIIGLIGLIFNQLCLYSMIDIIGANIVFSKIISTAIVFVWNFGARKIILF